MDHIDNIFTEGTLPTSENNPAVRAAIEVAKKTLNRYYSLTDLSELYRIAMSASMLYSPVLLLIYPTFLVLHPRHKLAYFKAAGWDQDWINTAKDLVRDQFEDYASRSGYNATQQAEESVATSQPKSAVRSLILAQSTNIAWDSTGRGTQEHL
jgi:hypothetical protein